MQDDKGMLTELEIQLAGENGAALRQRLRADLGALEDRLATRLTGMLARDEYASLVAALNATRSARRVVEKWVPGTGQPSRGRG